MSIQITLTQEQIQEIVTQVMSQLGEGEKPQSVKTTAPAKAPTAKKKPTRTKKSSGSENKKDRDKAVRAWAQLEKVKSDAGKLLGDRGRIPRDIYEKFDLRNS